jgi:hypothetical protein
MRQAAKAALQSAGLTRLSKREFAARIRCPCTIGQPCARVNVAIFPELQAHARQADRSRRSRRWRRAAFAVLAALHQSRKRMAQRIVREQRQLLDKAPRATADRPEPK